MAGSNISDESLSITTTTTGNDWQQLYNNINDNHHQTQQQHYDDVINNNTVTRDTWQVQYAHYFVCPDLPSSGGVHPALVPLARRIKGTWLSSVNAPAYLELLTNANDSRSVVLTVTLVDNVVEEHYVSKLHFTWPQAACLSGYPPRGSKVVFMSYKDQVGQIQKFAVRFVTLYETEHFVNSIKEIFGHERINGSMHGISKSKTSSQSEIFPGPLQDWDPITSSVESYKLNSFSGPPQDCDPITSSVEFPQLMYRPTRDWSPIASTADTYVPPMHPSENHDGSQSSNPLETTLSPDTQGKLSALPPSFTSLLMSCFPAAEQELQSTIPEEVALKKEIMKYLEDSSFHDMLSKVQKVVNGFEDDLLSYPSC